MQKHITLLAVLHIVYGSLSFLGALFVLLVFSSTGAFLRRLLVHELTPVDVVGIVWAVGLVVAAGLILVSLPGIIGGIGLLKHKEWARILTLIVGFVSLVRIPLGTALGIYTIWVLMNDEVVRLFSAPAAPDPSAHTYVKDPYGKGA